MPKNELLESQIRDSLAEKANQIAASELLKIKIHNKLISQEIKENSMKKIFSYKKVVVLFAVICCLATATVFASGTISSYVGSTNKNEAYTEIPSAKALSKDIGFTPKIIASFSNGYSFKEATISNTNGQSDSGEVLSHTKGLDTDYVSSDGQNVTLTSYQSGFFDNSRKVDEKADYLGIDLIYSKQVYKFVPEGYQLTSDDQEAKANGSVVFSYGSDEIETTTYQFVSWSDGNVDYQLLTENVALSYTDLFTMAEELISLK